MCVIIDANHIHKIFLNGAPTSSHLKYLKSKITSQRVKMVYGGKLKREYLCCQRFLPFLAELKRNGSAVSIDDSLISGAEQNLPITLMASNDAHIIALALASGARILVTDDGSLKSDFKNTQLVRPKGKIYPISGYQALLNRCR